MRDLWSEAIGPGYAVRRVFQLVPTDDRWLDMDPDQVLSEAALIRLHDLHQARQANPVVHDMTEPGMVEAMVEANKSERDDTAFQEKVAKFFKRARGVEPGSGNPGRDSPPRRPPTRKV